MPWRRTSRSATSTARSSRPRSGRHASREREPPRHMPGIDPTVAREPLHRRTIEINGYKREDGLYDIEGHLVDTKPHDFKLAAGVRPANQAIHGMWLRITVDRNLVIVDAAAAMDAMPYVDHCDQIVPAYRKLVGI